MPWTHDIGPLYFHTLRVERPDRPWSRAWTTEVEEPFREGRGVAVRVSRRTFVVVGCWHHTDRDEDEALATALGATAIEADIEELKTWDGPAPEDSAEGNDSGETYRVIAYDRAGDVGGAVPVPDREGSGGLRP